MPDLKRFSGEIYFKFTELTDEAVTVVPITYAEIDRRAGEGKPPLDR